jgi:hypothetical protein
MTKKTEIWIIFWSIKVENVDHGILTSSYSVTFKISMIDEKIYTDNTYLSVNQDQEE